MNQNSEDIRKFDQEKHELIVNNNELIKQVLTNIKQTLNKH